MHHTGLTKEQRTRVLAQIQQCLLFSGLHAEQHEALLAKTHIRELEENAVLFEQQQPAQEIFLLESGQIKLARMSPDGQEKIIDLISPGNSFAEAILFSKHHVYPVTATAIVASRVFCFDASTYADILHHSTDACFAVMAQMSLRLHWQIGEIDRLTLHNATFRVISYLLDQVPSTHLGASEVRLDTPKHVIASRLSIKPETLSRTFAKLGREGLLSIQDNAVLLNDVERLRRYVQGMP